MPQAAGSANPTDPTICRRTGSAATHVLRTVGLPQKGARDGHGQFVAGRLWHRIESRQSSHGKENDIEDTGTTSWGRVRFGPSTLDSTPFDVPSWLVMRSTVFGIADPGQGRMSLIGQARGCRHHPDALTSTAAPFTRS